MRPHPETAQAPVLRAATGQCRGSVLPLALIVLSVMTLLCLQTLRTTVTAAGLVRSLHGAATAAGTARSNTAAALAAVALDPGLLPPGAPGTRRDMATASNAGGTAHTTLVFMGSDAVCPRLPGQPASRSHYEIISSVTTAQGAAHTEYQGFYICTELCTAPCIPAVTPPVATYWRSGPAP
ncbi:MAG: hypothetical protein V2J12_00630 [Gammaproteobacteria bacterium]|jgi:hypothetical protein|nr:hypothetical protein [Gammaproteobacteria bacterium]